MILVLGAVCYGIFSALSTKPAKAAYKALWLFDSDCDNGAEQARKKFKEETKDLTDEEKAELKKALEDTRKEVADDKANYSGEKKQVLRKLDVLIKLL